MDTVIFEMEKHWDLFLTNSLAINFPTKELLHEFLSFCHEKNLKWRGGADALRFNPWDIERNTTCLKYSPIKHVGFLFDVTLSGLSYANVKNYASQGIPIVYFNGFKKRIDPPKETTKEFIEIIYHGKETIVLIKEKGKYFKGVTRCHDEDDYNQVEGLKFAYERAKENQKAFKSKEK